MSSATPFKINDYFGLRVAEAHKTAKRFSSSGEYNWAKEWERYAAQLYGYAQKYQRQVETVKYNRSRGMEQTDPVLELPLQPRCLSHYDEYDEAGKLIFAQLTHRGHYRRPAMYQSAQVNVRITEPGTRVFPE